MASLWHNVIQRLHEHIPSDQIDEWLSPTEVLDASQSQITLVVPNDVFIDWIRENYLDEIQLVIANLGFPDCKVLFVSRDEARRSQNEPKTNGSSDSVYENRGALKLNPKYKFQNFVVGTSNQFAHAASLAVAEAPSSSYNPLFIYGSSGLGKTHLLHAIGHALCQNRPDLKICYTTCEEFTNQFINSIRYNKSETFREYYRSVDALLIDDIQFLSGKMQTQEEFFHTFNALFEYQKQIILSSDSAPGEIAKLEARLTSRFQWGLIADIQPPPLETRIAILKKKAEAERIFLPDNVVLFAASKVKTNVRELEGALVKLMAYASLGNRKINLELAEQALRNYVKHEPSQISCERIMKFVADHYKLHQKELCSKNNSKRIAQPRQIAMYLIRQLTDMSFPEIGVAFGNKHHSTVVYSVQKIAKQISENAEYREMITGFKKSLT